LPIFASGAKHTVLLNPASDQLTGCREIKRVDTDNCITLSTANRTAARANTKQRETARNSAKQRETARNSATQRDSAGFANGSDAGHGSLLHERIGEATISLTVAGTRDEAVRHHRAAQVRNAQVCNE
jgi:hypothetical protein